MNPGLQLEAHQVNGNLVRTGKFTDGIGVVMRLAAGYEPPERKAPPGASLLVCPAAWAPPPCVHMVPACHWEGQAYSIRVVDSQGKPVFWISDSDNG